MLLLMIFCITHSTTEAILQITDNEYPMMEGIKLISDELFPPGQPLVIVLPLVEEHLTKSEVDYLIKELHPSSRWPIIVVNITHEMNIYMTIEINQAGSYVILKSGNCQQFDNFINDFRKQWFGLFNGTVWPQWNASAWFVVALMTPCKHYDNTFISKAILVDMWNVKVTNVVVVFKGSSGHVSKFHQQNISDSEPQVLFSLQTWFPYENSQRCNPDEGNVPLHTFVVRNVTDIEYTRKLEKAAVKNFGGCHFGLFAIENSIYVRPPNLIFNNDSRKYEFIYEEGLDIRMMKLISESLNISFVFQPERRELGTGTEGYLFYENLLQEVLNNKSVVVVGGLGSTTFPFNYLENSHGYLNIRSYWITPSATKYNSANRIFKTFSREVWILVTVMLVFVVISVKLISFCGQKIHLNEHTTYENVPSITSNVIAIALGVSVATQPRTAPLRKFFFSWVCYSIAISTVFQAFFTTFIIEPGYEEPVKNKEQLFNSGRKFGPTFYDEEFKRLGNAECPNFLVCSIWAALHQNISTITLDIVIDALKNVGFLTDKYNRPAVSELEDGNFRNSELVILVFKGHFLLEHFNKVIDHIVEAGLPTKWIQSISGSLSVYINESYSHSFADSYLNMNMTHFQPAFYVMLLGYILSLLSLVFEIVWHRLTSKRWYITLISVSPGTI